jgi:aminoacrylate peracid reductase
MTGKIIQLASFPEPAVKSSAGVFWWGRTLYISGMLALARCRKVVGVGDIEARTRHVTEAIRTVVEEAGGTMSSVAHNAIFLKDFALYAGINKVYGDYFPAGALPHPGRSLQGRVLGADFDHRLPRLT